MSTFPTKVLLAIDGSEEASVAAQTAADLAVKTGSELHVVYVRNSAGPHYPGDYVGPEVRSIISKENRGYSLERLRAC